MTDVTDAATLGVRVFANRYELAMGPPMRGTHGP